MIWTLNTLVLYYYCFCLVFVSSLFLTVWEVHSAQPMNKAEDRPFEIHALRSLTHLFIDWPLVWMHSHWIYYIYIYISMYERDNHIIGMRTHNWFADDELIVRFFYLKVTNSAVKNEILLQYEWIPRLECIINEITGISRHTKLNVICIIHFVEGEMDRRWYTKLSMRQLTFRQTNVEYKGYGMSHVHGWDLFDRKQQVDNEFSWFELT